MLLQSGVDSMRCAIPTCVFSVIKVQVCTISCASKEDDQKNIIEMHCTSGHGTHVSTEGAAVGLERIRRLYSKRLLRVKGNDTGGPKTSEDCSNDRSAAMCRNGMVYACRLMGTYSKGKDKLQLT